MEYKILTMRADSLLNGTQFEAAAVKLAEEVNAHVAIGWEPQGGVCVGQTTSLRRPYLFQALVKRR